MPQPPTPIELEATPILLGVDHEHPTRTDHQVIDIGPAAGESQVMQDRPPLHPQVTDLLAFDVDDPNELSLAHLDRPATLRRNR